MKSMKINERSDWVGYNYFLKKSEFIDFNEVVGGVYYYNGIFTIKRSVMNDYE